MKDERSIQRSILVINTLPIKKKTCKNITNIFLIENIPLISLLGWVRMKSWVDVKSGLLTVGSTLEWDTHYHAPDQSLYQARFMGGFEMKSD